MEAAVQALQLPGRANPIFLEGKLLPLQAEVAKKLNLSDSQVVQANLHVRGDEPLLMLRGQALPLAAGAMRLREGPVWLQVHASGQDCFLQPTPAPASDPTPSLVSRLNQLLFRPAGQADMAQLLQSGTLPKLLQLLGRPELQQLWQGWQQSMASITPQALARAVASALGNEVWLSRGQTSGLTDPRQLLRKLLQALREQSPDNEAWGLDLDLNDSIGQVRASLDNLESHQVQAAQAQAQQEMLLNVVIPFADADPVELEFRRSARQGDKKMPLTVNLHTRSHDLGEVWLRTQLQEVSQLELTMWAVREDVVVMARQQAPQLTRMLTEAGLSMKSLQILHGMRPTPTLDWVPSGRGMVVDCAA